MRIMDLNNVKPCLQGPFCAIYKCLDNLGNSFFAQLFRLRIGRVERDRRRSPNVIWPSTYSLRCCLVPTYPGRNSGCFAPSVCKLNSYLLVLRMSKLDDFGKGPYVRVGPDPRVFRCDTAFWKDGCGFNEGETWATREDTAN